MADFTLKKYVGLLKALRISGYAFITYAEYCAGKRPERFVILRHDVDLKPRNALLFANMEGGLGIRSTYYFRVVPESWDPFIMGMIHRLDHEIGYHYESLTTCNGDVQKAYADFTANLARFREICPVETISMHGSPRSPYDSKDIWKEYDFRELGITGEPYLTTDFSKMLYLTDTGRRWDGYKVSVRDIIEGYQEQWQEKGWVFHRTRQIIKAAEKGALPEQLMITTHPQRWNPMGLSWLKELLVQNMKNVVKALIVKRQNR